MNALANSILGNYNAKFMPSRSSECSTEQVIAEWNDGAGGMVTGTDATPVSGGIAGSYLPANIAMVLSWRISVRYRGGHPRSYHAGWADTWTASATQWNATDLAAYQTEASAFLTAINAIVTAPFSSVTLGVLRQFAHGGSETKPPTFLDPPVFQAFSSVIVKPGIATQRRRLGANFS